MRNINKNNFLFDDISSVQGVGLKLKKYLKNKKIEKVKDVLWDLPYEIVDRSNITSIDKLEIGKIATIKVKVFKYNFPRIRNLPFRVICKDYNDIIDIIFFNSREGYIRKVLPLKKKVIISGKISYFRNKYQIVNPTYIEPLENEDKIKKIFPKYSLTEGLNEKVYRALIKKVLNEIEYEEWHSKEIIKTNKFKGFKDSLLNLHSPDSKIDINSNEYKRIAYDEIFSNLFVLSSARKNIKNKKKPKIYDGKLKDKILKIFSYQLTDGQKKVMNDLENDFRSNFRMFRLLQGDVGSGKTILALIGASNVIEAGYQVAFMAPTEILATQHYNLSLGLFKSIKIKLLTSKTKLNEKKKILEDLKSGKISMIIGTHSLFQKKIIFKKLGFIIIDEQHKFGVKQRISLAKKGGKDCDLLLMSATPIPRTMMLSQFGDMDVSRLFEKPKNRKNILTLSKPEEKIHEIIPLLKNQIKLDRQIFWVCPIIEESKKLNYSSAVSKYKFINSIFPNKVGLIHGNLNKNERNKVLENFENKKFKILVSTTVIEVGIDFPNANIIVIENSDKFGLSQLHQLRGRVGRSSKESICILLYKKNLSNNAKKRLKILKSTNDGFVVAEEDLVLRGHGDILGFQQSGLKSFRFADPVHHKDLFYLAEQNIERIDIKDLKKYENLLKLHDKAEIINSLES